MPFSTLMFTSEEVIFAGPSIIGVKKRSLQRSYLLHVSFIYVVNPYCLSNLINFTVIVVKFPHFPHEVFEN